MIELPPDKESLEKAEKMAEDVAMLVEFEKWVSNKPHLIPTSERDYAFWKAAYRHRPRVSLEPCAEALARRHAKKAEGVEHGYQQLMESMGRIYHAEAKAVLDAAGVPYDEQPTVKG
jgi:hypothetical protein